MEATIDDAYLIGQSYYYRGIAKGNAGDNRGALQDFNKSLALTGPQAGAYFSRAIAKIHLHDLSGALQDYQNAVRMEKNVAFDEYLTEDPEAFPEFLAYCRQRGIRLYPPKSS